MTIRYSIGSTVASAEVANFEAGDFEEFCSVALAQGAGSSKKDGSYFCAAMRGGRRLKDNAEGMSVLALDFDALPGADALVRLMDESQAWRALGYTTASHDPAAGKFKARLIFELDRPATAQEYPRVARAVTAELATRTGIALEADAAVMKIEQPVYTLRAGASTWQHFDGPPVCVDKALRLNGHAGEIHVVQAEGERIPAGRRNATLTARAGAMRRAGFDSGAILAALRQANASCNPPLPAAEIERIAASVARYAPAAADGVPDEDGAFVGPVAAAVGLPALIGEPYQAPDVVEGLYPRDAGVLVAPGETGKTTIALYEAAHLVLGMPLYGHKTAQAGGALIVTAEDDGRTLAGRLGAIVQAMDVSETERERLAEHIFIEDISVRPVRLMASIEGHAMRTAYVDELVDKYRGEGLAMAHLDPLSLIGPGEELGNDGMSEMMRTLRYLSRELGCCVRAAHHVSKEVARNGILDQYAGRGASALADNGRFVTQLARIYDRAIKTPAGAWLVPAAVPDSELKERGVLAMIAHKHSYRAKRAAPIILRRDGFAFAWSNAERSDGRGDPAAAAATLVRDCGLVCEFVSARERDVPPSRYSRRRLDDAIARIGGGLTRARLRDAVGELLATRRLFEIALPKSDQKGQLKSCLSTRPTDLAGPRE